MDRTLHDLDHMEPKVERLRTALRKVALILVNNRKVPGACV
jgi:hypothetical protein